uniref:G protein-coupled receptor n=1 Tax=Ascaris lumbricoides TaxID=6252 RepID=A0A0M3IJD8_ASCLU
MDRVLPIFIGDQWSNLTENRSTDIFCKNCVTDFDKVACIRSTTLGLLSAITSACCAVRIFSLHRPSRVHYHKLILFYVLLIQSLSGSLEWLLGWKSQAALVNVYARSLELLIIFHLYLMMACRLMHWTEDEAAARLSLSGLAVMLMYFTVLVYTGLVFAMEPWRDCHAPYWIWLSAGNVVTVQMIVISFIVIIHRLNRVSPSESTRRGHKCQLYSLLWAFETSTLVDLGYHITLYLLASEEEGCNAVFRHDQVRYTIVKVPYELISFLMPIWVILFVFRSPRKSCGDDSDSTFFTQSAVRSLSNVVVVRNWHRRYRPLGSSQWAFVNPAVQVASQRSRRIPSSRSGADGAILRGAGTRAVVSGSVRRCHSAPNLTPPLRRNSLPHSFLSSPLYAIPEETSGVRSESISSSISSGNTSLETIVDSN